jgi:hypothetical protein
MSDEELILALESGTLDPENFHHRDHIRLAWSLLKRDPFAAALARFSDGLRRFAAGIGKPGVYHETITCAFIVLIHERMQGGQSWEDFASANRDLFAWKPSVLDRYYTAETLASDRARRVFVMPDRGLESYETLR